MKFNKLLLVSIFVISALLLKAQSLQPLELIADYGPPSKADSFELFTIPIIPESFDVDTATLISALENVTSFKIRTEMHTGSDVGGIDNVEIGSVYASYFDNSHEGWSSGGDGTLSWISEGGISGGYIQMADWATGDWHWAIAPLEWAGDWSALFGETISFYFKTNRPSYAAVVVLTTEEVNRLVLNPAVSLVPLNDSLLVKLEITPPPAEDLTISLSSSNTNCIIVPGTVIIEAGHSYVEFYALAAEGAELDCYSVIVAAASGYGTSRITLRTVEENYGIQELNKNPEIRISPNPCLGYFHIFCNSEAEIDRVIIYNVSGESVFDKDDESITGGRINTGNLQSGIHFVRIFAGGKAYTVKIIIGQ